VRESAAHRKMDKLDTAVSNGHLSSSSATCNTLSHCSWTVAEGGACWFVLYPAAAA
jgi:hypothetical protein